MIKMDFLQFTGNICLNIDMKTISWPIFSSLCLSPVSYKLFLEIPWKSSRVRAKKLQNILRGVSLVALIAITDAILSRSSIERVLLARFNADASVYMSLCNSIRLFEYQKQGVVFYSSWWLNPYSSLRFLLFLIMLFMSIWILSNANKTEQKVFVHFCANFLIYVRLDFFSAGHCNNLTFSFNQWTLHLNFEKFGEVI